MSASEFLMLLLAAVALTVVVASAVAAAGTVFALPFGIAVTVAGVAFVLLDGRPSR